ncbi:RDD family protein [Hymenobacter elongatus]|uniref:RDD family protein n=1 Tax=Hymenobacter elongatus TaxID=877208 RepID=UPI001436A519|nr:RDD family protein [Hymenobacter elongatus]
MSLPKAKPALPGGFLFCLLTNPQKAKVKLIYSAWMETTPYAGSLGKHVMGLKVVDLDGEPISRTQAWGRNITKLVSFIPLFIGALWILVDKRNQAWHDKAAKTLVVAR